MRISRTSFSHIGDFTKAGNRALSVGGACSVGGALVVGGRLAVGMMIATLALFVISIGTPVNAQQTHQTRNSSDVSNADRSQIQNAQFQNSRRPQDHSQASQPEALISQQFASERNDSAPVNHIGEGTVDIQFCRVMLISEIEVPAQESGPIVAMPVREGQTVTAHQELARIDDSLARLRLETAQTKLDAATQKANNDIDVRAASNALEIAERERKRNYRLYSNGSMPKAEYDRSALQSKQASLQQEQARRDMQASMKEAQIESYNVKAANDSILRHRIASPIDALVMEIRKEPGEWVNAGDNVMRIARMDRLHVQGFLDSSLFNPHEVLGKRVTITVPVARNETLEFEGHISYVAAEKNSPKSYSIRAEVNNREHDGRWLLMANEEVTMRVYLEQQSVTRLPATDGSQR